MKRVIFLSTLAVLLAGCGESGVTSLPVLAASEPPASSKQEAGAVTAENSDSKESEAEATKDAGKQAAEQSEREDMEKRVERTEAEWRKLLTPQQYYVLRKKGTERPYTNKYDRHFEPGSYACAACGQELFESKTKFNSGCGWPAFYAAKAGDRVNLHPDRSLGMFRTEVTCARCDSHLGHVFDDAPRTPTGNRFCINSVSLVFKPAKKAEDGNESQDDTDGSPDEGSASSNPSED